jgi:hypothetical protein
MYYPDLPLILFLEEQYQVVKEHLFVSQLNRSTSPVISLLISLSSPRVPLDIVIPLDIVAPLDIVVSIDSYPLPTVASQWLLQACYGLHAHVIDMYTDGSLCERGL